MFAPSHRLLRRKAISAVITMGTVICALAVIVVLLVIFSQILTYGVRELSWGFLVNTPKPYGEPDNGIANAIVGTLVLLAVASVIGLPIGILAGLYLAEFGTNRTGAVLRFLIEVLTGIPSIIVGVFVWTLMVKPTRQFSALAGGVSLAIIMMPIVARTTEEMIRLVPHSLREAALALGAPVWRTSIGVVLRSAAGGVATGAMLAIARVAGETAPLLFTALSNNLMSTALDQRIASLPYQIFYYQGSAYEEWHSMAWSATLVLILLILGINAAVRVFGRSRYQ